MSSPELGIVFDDVPQLTREVRSVMNRIATNNSADQVDIGGTFRTRVSDVTVDGDTATAVTCDDYREATFAGTPETAGFGEPRSEEVELQRQPDGRWVIATTVGVGSC